MTIRTAEQEEQEVKRWEDIGYKHEHRGRGGAFKAFTDAITQHRNKGHYGMSTFWDFTCACDFQARLMIWSGEPFNPNGRGRFATTIEDNGGKVLVTEDYPY